MECIIDELYILNHQFLLVLELGNGKDLHVSFRHVTRLLLRVSKEVLRHYRSGGTCCVSCFKESQCPSWHIIISHYAHCPTD